jgi:fibronectin-binding autotransporter adhesin
MIRPGIEWLRSRWAASKWARRTRRFRPEVTQLEERCLLSNLVVTVNSAGDDPAGPTQGVVTLRDAITQVNNDTNDSSTSPDVINFAITGTPTILLGGDLPSITRPLTIDGSTQAGVTVNGNGFAMLAANSAVTVNDMTFSGGTASLGSSASLTVGSGSSLSVAGDLNAGNNANLKNDGSVAVSGNFVGGDAITVTNAPFSNGTTTYADSFTVGGSFNAGQNSLLYNNGTSTFSVTKDFTLAGGGDGGLIYNGLSPNDAATFSVGGSFSIGTALGEDVFNKGSSHLNVTGDCTIGDNATVYNGYSSTDAATWTVGGSLKVGAEGEWFNQGTSHLRVTGDCTVGDNNIFYNGYYNTDAAIWTVDGSFTLGLGEQINNEGSSQLNVTGNLSVGSGTNLDNYDTAQWSVTGNVILQASDVSVYNDGAATWSVAGNFRACSTRVRQPVSGAFSDNGRRICTWFSWRGVAENE